MHVGTNALVAMGMHNINQNALPCRTHFAKESDHNYDCCTGKGHCTASISSQVHPMLPKEKGVRWSTCHDHFCCPHGILELLEWVCSLGAGLGQLWEPAREGLQGGNRIRVLQLQGANEVTGCKAGADRDNVGEVAGCWGDERHH